MTDAERRVIRVRLTIILLVVPAMLMGFAVAADRLQLDVAESARRSAVCLMALLGVLVLSPLVGKQPAAERSRRFVTFWFVVSTFFNVTWQVPLILFRDTITVAPHTHDNLYRFIAWWGYGFADAHYGRVSQWMMSEELWWLAAIALSVVGLRRVWTGREPSGFLLLGVAGALESYNASLYIVYDVMTGLENVPDDSITSLILYWGFNPLWAGAAGLASWLSFRFVLEMAERGHAHDPVDTGGGRPAKS